MTWALEILKIFTFTGSFCAKYNVLPKKVQRSYLSWHWTVMQILKKNWLVLWKITWGICKYLPEHLKISKLGLWWHLFMQNRKCMSLKFTEELCVITMKNHAKYDDKLICRFKIDNRNLRNFDSSTQKSEKFAL